MLAMRQERHDVPACRTALKMPRNPVLSGTYIRERREAGDGPTVLGIRTGRVFSKFGVSTIRTTRTRPGAGGRIFERQLHTSSITSRTGGPAKTLEMRIAVERQTTSFSKAQVKADIMFKVDGKTDIPKCHTGLCQVRKILATVHNGIADFISEEVADGNAIAVRFRAATPRHAKFYERMAVELEAVYGVCLEKGETRLGKRDVPEFRLRFSVGHRFPRG